jgi:hypothetical protein
VFFVAIKLSVTHAQKQRANDRDHDQEFDQGKSGTSRSVHDVTSRVGVDIQDQAKRFSSR